MFTKQHTRLVDCTSCTGYLLHLISPNNFCLLAFAVNYMTQRCWYKKKIPPPCVRGLNTHHTLIKGLTTHRTLIKGLITHRTFMKLQAHMNIPSQHILDISVFNCMFLFCFVFSFPNKKLTALFSGFGWQCIIHSIHFFPVQYFNNK